MKSTRKRGRPSIGKPTAIRLASDTVEDLDDLAEKMTADSRVYLSRADIHRIALNIGIAKLKEERSKPLPPRVRTP